MKITDFFGIDVLRNCEVNLLSPSEYGCSMVDRAGKWIIVYEDTDPPARIRFTIAHELGHILLGHEISAGFGHYRRIYGNKPANETQADEFAVRLLAPACVLWALNATTPEEIAEVCEISRTAAQYRAKRMAVLMQRNAFLMHPLEKQLYTTFLPWIEQQKIRAE